MKKYYSQYHEWIAIDGNKAIVGITNEAQNELKEIVFIDLPLLEKSIERGEEVCVVESTKAATDLSSPLSGKITKVNTSLKEDCMKMQTMKEEDRWIYEIEIKNPLEIDELLTIEQYQALQCR